MHLYVIIIVLGGQGFHFGVAPLGVQIVAAGIVSTTNLYIT